MLAANNQPPPLWLRVNRRRTTRAPSASRRSRRAGFVCSTDVDASDAIRITPHTDVRSLPGFAAGLVSVQDAAAQLAIDVLAPRGGERVLDACAAPGGKTGHVLERTDGAVELRRGRRLRRPARRVSRTTSRVWGSRARRSPAMRRGRRTGGTVARSTRVLLDAPCSATGVIRRHPDIKILRRPGDIPALARMQSALLEALWPLVAPGRTPALHDLLGAARREPGGRAGSSCAGTREAQRRHGCTHGDVAIPRARRWARLPALDRRRRDGWLLLCLSRQAFLNVSNEFQPRQPARCTCRGYRGGRLCSRCSRACAGSPLAGAAETELQDHERELALDENVYELDMGLQVALPPEARAGDRRRARVAARLRDRDPARAPVRARCRCRGARAELRARLSRA